ncbi:MAG: archaellin/type IV pilin N-terminal domain-containing protein [Candidatus Woesearchaeota archaeon]
MTKSKKGEMGMGTLIIFIAMVLVAAVAAGVLITTTNSLQNRALTTGRATSSEVGTNLNVLEVYAEDASTVRSIGNMTAVVKLAAGSESVRLSDLLVSLELNNMSKDYRYTDNDTVTCDTMTIVDNETFVVDYMIQGNTHIPGYMTTGDVIKLCIMTPRQVLESENFGLSIIPRAGTPTLMNLVTPELMTQRRVPIFP